MRKRKPAAGPRYASVGVVIKAYGHIEVIFTTNKTIDGAVEWMRLTWERDKERGELVILAAVASSGEQGLYDFQ